MPKKRRVTITLSQEEYERLLALATQQKKRVAAKARELVLPGLAVPTEVRKWR